MGFWGRRGMMSEAGAWEREGGGEREGEGEREDENVPMKPAKAGRKDLGVAGMFVVDGRVLGRLGYLDGVLEVLGSRWLFVLVVG